MNFPSGQDDFFRIGIQILGNLSLHVEKRELVNNASDLLVSQPIKMLETTTEIILKYLYCSQCLKFKRVFIIGFLQCFRVFFAFM